MGQITLKNGKLDLVGVAPYELTEDNLSRELVQAMLDEPLGSETFLGDLARDMEPETKEVFRQFCRLEGGSLWRQCCVMCAKWAPLLNADNKWHLEDFDIIFDAVIDAWWAQRVIVTSSNIRFVGTPRGLFTFPEFHHVYGLSILDHLHDYAAARKDEIRSVVDYIQAELVKKEVIIADSEGRQMKSEIAVLENQPQDLWRVPSGYTLLYVEESS